MADDAQPAEERGVLGNLPRTRPGRRSEKRAAGRPAASAPKADSGGVKTASPPEPPRESGTGGPLEGLAHGVGKVAGAGVRAAGGLAREFIRRVPRP
jgi:hypothetical protein